LRQQKIRFLLAARLQNRQAVFCFGKPTAAFTTVSLPFYIKEIKQIL